eukprot:2616282-Prymnesium_polylepis.1
MCEHITASIAVDTGDMATGTATPSKSPLDSLSRVIRPYAVRRCLPTQGARDGAPSTPTIIVPRRCAGGAGAAVAAREECERNGPVHADDALAARHEKLVGHSGEHAVHLTARKVGGELYRAVPPAVLQAEVIVVAKESLFQHEVLGSPKGSGRVFHQVFRQVLRLCQNPGIVKRLELGD